ncbi:MAG: hypothetical protein GY866_09075 [Proteobacteria bacterium]|nr:hypothetical protein [Pseudomonadota bacterium]
MNKFGMPRDIRVDEVLAVLNKEILSKYREMRGAIKINSVKDLALRIRSLGEEYHVESLSEFGGRLEVLQ